MKENIKKLIIRELYNLIQRIDNGNSNLTNDEAMGLLSIIAHEAMSKEEACTYLNISPATLDNYVKNGYLPKPHKVKGFKELRYYKDELIINFNR